MLPFQDRDGFIWMNGELVPWRDAKLHVLSHGLHYASCVFEGERAYNGTTANTYSGSEPITVFQVQEIPKLATAFVACALYVGRNNATGDTVDVGGFSFRMNPGLWGKARQILVPPYHNYYYGRAYG